MSKGRIFTTLIFALILSCICGYISFASGNMTFFDAVINAGITILKIFLILLIAYAPFIWLIRKWWKRRFVKAEYRNSQKARAWNKFLLNNNAMAGMITIFYAVILFVFGHFIAPDKTPDANYQMNEISFQEPGFTVNTIKLPSARPVVKKSLISRLVHGSPESYQEIPVSSYRFAADSIYVERYFGEGISGSISGYKLSELTGQNQSTLENKKAIQNELIQKRKFIFGTDDLGRDYLSRIILGVRVSLLVGFVAVVIALFIGIPLGAFAGFYKKELPVIRFGKKHLKFPLDDIIMWFINVIWAIPTLLLVFPIVFAFGQNYYTIFIAVGLTMWVDIARIVRGQVMQIRSLEFIQAAKSFGYSHMRTIFIHILPNITGPIIVITAANFAYAILTEAGLSFLGIGVQPPAASWGLMISKYKDNLITEPYLTLIPGIAITLLVLAFFMIGNGVRDALDVKAKVEH